MDEEITRLALECLKIDLERLKLIAETNRLNAEGFRDLISLLSPVLQAIVALIEFEGEFSSETFEEIAKIIPGFVTKLSVSDFIKFATTISDEALESLIADLQGILDARGED